MSYSIQFHTCKDRAAGMNPEPGTESDRFATFADRLFLGRDLQVDIPRQAADEHIDQVSLIYQKHVVASVYLMCPCTARVTNEHAKSDLLVPEKQLLIPRR